MSSLSAPSSRTLALGAHCRTLRQARGWSGDELSARLYAVGVPVPRLAITRWENGRRANFTVDELCALAEVFETAVADLLAFRCPHCAGNPPAGYSCRHCGAAT